MYMYIHIISSNFLIYVYTYTRATLDLWIANFFVFVSGFHMDINIHMLNCKYNVIPVRISRNNYLRQYFAWNDPTYLRGE